MAQNKLDKLIHILICACMIMVILLSVTGILWFRKTELPYTIRGYDKKNEVLKSLYDEYRKPFFVQSNQHYRDLIEKDLNFYFYFYSEMDLEKNAGKCFITIRLIVIDRNLSGNQYCYTLAHEMMHLKKFRKQENYICFETFKYLYESDTMHNVGVWYAIKQLEGAYSGEYNISNQIVDYLIEKGG